MSNDKKSNDERRSARKRAEKLGLSQAPLTIAICGDEKTAKCASACELRESWKHLRAIAKSRRKRDQPPITVLRIACPGVCRFGPVAAVFPSGTWYGGCNPETLDKIIKQHLKNDPANVSDLDRHQL